MSEGICHGDSSTLPKHYKPMFTRTQQTVGHNIAWETSLPTITNIGWKGAVNHFKKVDFYKNIILLVKNSLKHIKREYIICILKVQTCTCQYVSFVFLL